MADTTVVRKCNCENTVQDSIYGKGMRLMNKTFKGEVKCTVCATRHKPDIVPRGK